MVTKGCLIGVRLAYTTTPNARYPDTAICDATSQKDELHFGHTRRPKGWNHKAWLVWRYVRT